jgi:hypothetical protein
MRTGASTTPTQTLSKDPVLSTDKVTVEPAPDIPEHKQADTLLIRVRTDVYEDFTKSEALQLSNHLRWLAQAL